MRSSLDETLRRGLVRGRYRVLLDASNGLDGLWEDLTLHSGPKPCPTQPELLTAMCLVSARPSTKAARQLRRQFAAAGAPVMRLGAKGIAQRIEHIETERRFWMFWAFEV